jgi:DNA-binding response OmpR family regulator
MRILAIEDEQKVSALIKRGLISERYAFDIAVDGIDGLELAEAYPYDLMILDLMIPRLTDAEVLQRVRRTRPTQKTPGRRQPRLNSTK